jgi:hypothetical protein
MDDSYMHNSRAIVSGTHSKEEGTDFTDFLENTPPLQKKKNRGMSDDAFWERNIKRENERSGHFSEIEKREVQSEMYAKGRRMEQKCTLGVEIYGHGRRENFYL